MPEPQAIVFISQQQYTQYTTAWLNLLNGGGNEALWQAFEAPGAARLNFLLFSLDQLLSLVTAAGGQRIKARFLLMPTATGQVRFSIALFAVDTDGHPLSKYYIPAAAAATTTQAVEPSAGPSTQIPRAVALRWLNDWVAIDSASFTTALFATSHGPLHGFNFEVSTFQDPLAGAQPYADKCLFLNCGLSTEAEARQIALAVYIGRIGSRTQGSLAGIPDDGTFYDAGLPCPPAI